MNRKRGHKPSGSDVSVGAGLKPALIETYGEQVMMGAGKKGAASGAPTCKQNAADQRLLPEGWGWKMLGEACTVILGQSPESISYNTEKEGLPFFQGKAEFGDLIPTVVKWCTAPKKVAKKNDILISVRAPVGPTNLAPSECCIGRGLAALRPLDDGDCLYLLHYLRSIEHKLSEVGTGTTFKSISGDVLRSIEVPIAPLGQQKLIVAEIEKQFSRLDEAVAGLKRIKANLKRYKASVLKAAVEGKLTEEWRKVHPNVETGADLLKRILAERKKKWEEKNPGKKYKEPVAPDTSNLPQLPKGWVWVALERLADVVDPQPSHRTPPEAEGGIPYIGMGDIDKSGEIDFHGARKVSIKVLDEHKERYSLKVGDFIFGKIGTIGKPVKLDPPFNYTLSANVVLIQPHHDIVYPVFCYSYMDSPLMDAVIRKESRATTQAAFGIQKVRVIPVSLPPFDEQREIAAEIDRRMSVAEEIEATVITNLTRAERLRQSILKKAFSGGLVS